MDKQLLFIIIFLAIIFTLSGILVMGAVPQIFKNAQITHDRTEELKEASYNQVELTFFNAFISYQNRIMIKELASELNITNLKDTPALNKTFEAYPHYIANRSHMIIHWDDNGNQTVMKIPETIRNLIYPFQSNVDSKVNKTNAEN